LSWAEGETKVAEESNDTHAGVVSGLAAGILIIALTAMAFVAFEPTPASPLRAATYEAGAIVPGT
jgi:hypothetical protein